MKVPYCCPVCGGNGILPHGFYDVPLGQEFSSTDYSHAKCRSCINGIIYVEDDIVTHGVHDVDEFYPENDEPD